MSWIDSKYAKVGNLVEFPELGGGLWTLTSTGSTTTEDVANKHRTFKNNI